MRYERAICWIRRDIRSQDHVALAAATSQARQVAVVFVLDRLILDALEDRDDRRMTFIYESLAELDRTFRERGSRLIVLDGDPVEEIPKLCARLKADALFFNEDVEPYAIQRDAKVRETAGVPVHSFKDHVIFIRDELLNQSGEPFKVFTPYSKAWKAAVRTADLQPHEPDLSRLIPAGELTEPELPSMEEIGFIANDLWLTPGESGAHERLNQFLPKLPHYGEDRDKFNLDATSGMSVHLRHGTISVRECFRAAVGSGSLEDPVSMKWFNELIWREFYHMILHQFPHVVSGAFKSELDQIDWPGDDELFEAWCTGRTGYPIVDAAMRCFNATGWMHNRLRMVVAMFLTKDLLVHWQRGEAYFARYLLDFDLAQNNGGWQWSASTGVDAQPYFRIFNPLLQSRKFDPEAGFIAEWCPELADFPPELRHWPHDASAMDQQMAGCQLGKDYPNPIVQHHEQKEKAFALFKL